MEHIALDYATAADFSDSSLADAFFISLFSLSLTSLYYLFLFLLLFISAFSYFNKKFSFFLKKLFFYYARRLACINKSIWWRVRSKNIFLPSCSPFYLSHKEANKDDECAMQVAKKIPLFMHRFLWIITNFIWRHLKSAFMQEMCTYWTIYIYGTCTFC